jgi:signal peptidase I
LRLYIRAVARVKPASGVAALIVVMLLVAGCGQKMVKIVGDAMAPALTDGQTVSVDTNAYASASPARGDMVLYKHNGDQIARVVGLPGETITFAAGVVVVNGTPLVESYLTAGVQTEAPQPSYMVPSDEYFLLHDNRARQGDSRSWGFIAKSDIEGKLG